MTYEEAMSEAVEGARVRCDNMLPGQYVEHSFSRGMLRCWPVDAVEEEPQRTQCDFRPTDAEEAASWAELERPKLDSWGKPIDTAFFAAMATERETVQPQGDPKRRRPIAHTPLGTPKPATSNTPEYVAAVDKLIGIEPAVPWGNMQLANSVQASHVEPDPLAGCGPAVSSPWTVQPAPVRDKWGRPAD